MRVKFWRGDVVVVVVVVDVATGGFGAADFLSDVVFDVDAPETADCAGERCMRDDLTNPEIESSKL